VNPRTTLAVGALLAVVAGPSVATAQLERYELGVRLRAFEQAFDDPGAQARRARAVPALQHAIRAMLAGQTFEAASALDDARWALRGDAVPTAAERFAALLAVIPAARLLDAKTETTLRFGVQGFAAADPSVPPDVAVRASVVSADGRTLAGPTTTPMRDLPAALRIPLSAIEPGDHALRVEILERDAVIDARSPMVSFVPSLAARLERLRAATSGKSTAAETLRENVQTLSILASRGTIETDVPAARLIGECEALAAAIGRSDADAARVWAAPGDHWVTLATGEGAVATRLFVPDDVATGKPKPLVIARHGAGGTENLFFDGYGRGAIVRECRARGWLLVAPRGGFFTAGVSETAIVAELRKALPIDSARVFLVGHSMGALQVAGAAQRAPSAFAAVAALGGGGASPSDALKDVAFFVGWGSADFEAPAGRAMAKALEAAGVKRVVTREYADVEHLAVVQVALPDVFRFFDEVSAAKATASTR
jgi:pimeloyl-ACP methyl ester carboxylesterase